MTEEKKKIVIAIASQTGKAELAKRIADKLKELAEVKVIDFENFVMDDTYSFDRLLNSPYYSLPTKHYYNEPVLLADIESCKIRDERADAVLIAIEKMVETMRATTMKANSHAVEAHWKGLLAIKDQPNGGEWEFLFTSDQDASYPVYKSFSYTQAKPKPHPKPDWKQKNFYKRTKPEKKVNPLLKKLTGAIK
jgi:signal recognition particle subunit SEC65